MIALSALAADFALARYLARRTVKVRDERLIRRITDGSLWIAGSPQNFVYAMGAMFNQHRALQFHLYRVREWKGLLIASRRVFWLADGGDVELLFDATVFVLPPWPEAVESAKIDQRQGAA